MTRRIEGNDIKLDTSNNLWKKKYVLGYVWVSEGKKSKIGVFRGAQLIT
jgi:hypothetical protein